APRTAGSGRRGGPDGRALAGSRSHRRGRAPVAHAPLRRTGAPCRRPPSISSVRERVARELDTEPEAETTELYLGLLQRHGHSAEPEKPGPTSRVPRRGRGQSVGEVPLV